MNTEVFDASGHSINRKDLGASSISGLALNCLPTTISRFVISVIVDSGNSHSDWALSHVCKEVRKCHPFFTNSYSPSSVVLKTKSLGVCASLDHSSPRLIRGTKLVGFGMSVFNLARHCIGVFNVVLNRWATSYNWRSPLSFITSLEI